MIVEMTFGSQLYGTAGPDSDLDLKGVEFPSFSNIVLQRVERSRRIGKAADASRRNGPEDIDHEVYSIHHFISMACRSETVAIDMLHARPNAWRRSSEIWEDLHGRRAEFYSRDLTALVGYARHQAAKYGVKGSRLAAAKEVVETLGRRDPEDRLRDIWDDLPANEHTRKLPSTKPLGQHRELYEVCGKKFHDLCRLREVARVLDEFIDRYGHRAQEAERNQGVDWKAMSHALRAGYQARAIYQDGDFEYPLQETEVLIKVKAGDWPYRKVAELLDELLDEIKGLADRSTLRQKVDRVQWDGWLIQQVGRYVGTVAEFRVCPGWSRA